HLLGAFQVAEVGRPESRPRREGATLLEDLGEAVGAARDDPDGRTSLGEDRRERGADARGCPGHENARALDLHVVSSCVLPSDCGPAPEKFPSDIVAARPRAGAPNPPARAAWTPRSWGAPCAASWAGCPASRSSPAAASSTARAASRSGPPASSTI